MKVPDEMTDRTPLPAENLKLGEGTALASPRLGRDERVFLAVVAAGVLVIATVTLFALIRTGPTPRNPTDVPARQLTDFTLTDRTGQIVQRADLTGQLLVVNFVFTSCSISCLQVNYRMAEIQSLTAGQRDVRLVSLSVDPKSDTPAMLSRFADRFGAQTNRWLFLTGDHRVMYSIIENSLLGPSDGNIPGVIPGVFVHSDQIALVDTNGQLQALFDGLKPDVAKDVTGTLAKLRRGEAVRVAN